MSLSRFEEIRAWQLARELNKCIYTFTRHSGFNKDYCLRDQLHRASVSIMLNIAEGFDSGSNQSFINFLRYSFRSAAEVKSVMYIALDLEYVTLEQFKDVEKQLDAIRNLIAGLIRYLNSTEKNSKLGR